MTAGRSAAHRRENQPGRCRDDDERCNLKKAHSFLSCARPKFWDSARVAKTNTGNNNELMLSTSGQGIGAMRRSMRGFVQHGRGVWGAWLFLIRPWTADEVVRAKAGRLPPAIHDLAAVLTNCGIRIGDRRFSRRHPIHRAAVALVLTGKPFVESETEYAPSRLGRKT
jgi:hypothetical protein